jgi:hypothetical protein
MLSSLSSRWLPGLRGVLLGALIPFLFAITGPAAAQSLSGGSQQATHHDLSHPISGPRLQHTPYGTPFLTLQMPNPFAYCTDDRAYIIGFRLPSVGFADGIPIQDPDLHGQLLYLWCPSWLSFFPDGVNFAELLVTNVYHACLVFGLGDSMPGAYLDQRFTLNAYAGVGLADSQGWAMATAAPPKTTRTLCPGQSFTLFSNVASGRYNYYAIAVFEVGIPSESAGWSDFVATPYAR